MAQTISLLTTNNIITLADTARDTDVISAKETQSAVSTLNQTVNAIKQAGITMTDKGDGIWEFSKIDNSGES